MKLAPYLVSPLALSLTLAASRCIAATDFEDGVPAEVVEQVLGSIVGGQTRLYADVLDTFPDFELPRGMEVLASLDQGWTQRVILTSRFDHTASSALAYSALLDAGWQLVPMYMPQPQSGFIVPNQPIPPTQLCHAEHGIMNVSTMSGSGATYVHFTRNITPPGAPPQANDCNTGLPQMPPDVADRVTARDPGQQLQQYVPRLELPNTADIRALNFGGGGGSPREYEARASLEGSWDIARVFNYFAEQMAEQGWERDVDVVGAQMASGSWTKTVAGDVELAGNLTVLAAGDNAYDLRLRIINSSGSALNTGGLRFGPGTQMGIRGIPAGATPIGVSSEIRDVVPAGARIVPYNVQGNGEVPPD